LSWPDRERLLHILRDAGVLWLPLTSGEPLIDKLFTEVYGLAYELGMMISISSNGSRLSNPRILELLTSRRPYRLTVSVYGATAESYDGLTRRRGSFATFERGLAAAPEAGLPGARSAGPALGVLPALRIEEEPMTTVAGHAMHDTGFGFLHQRWRTRQIDGPILVAVIEDHIIGAIEPLNILPDQRDHRMDLMASA
jgi:hypothetical protein